MSSTYQILFESKAYGFSIVHDGYGNNAAIISISNPRFSSSLQIGSWIIQINNIDVESLKFQKIAQLLANAKAPILIKFRAYSIISGTNNQLLSHQLTKNITIQLSDTGKQPAQKGKEKPFIAYNLTIIDGKLKWQIWKRFSQFEKLHKQLLKIIPKFEAQLPPRKTFGRFKPAFIEQRSDLLQKYITVIEQNEQVIKLNEFKQFVIPTPYEIIEIKEEIIERKAKQSVEIFNDSSEDTKQNDGMIKVHSMYIDQAKQIIKMLKQKNANLERKLIIQCKMNEERGKMYSEMLITKQQIEMENLVLKKQIQNMINNINYDDEKEWNKEYGNCKLKFEHWLCNVVKLGQYLKLFKQKEYNDVTLIEFFDQDTLNEIGIENKLHRKLIIKRVS
eukprot:280921_1